MLVIRIDYTLFEPQICVMRANYETAAKLVEKSTKRYRNAAAMT